MKSNELPLMVETKVEFLRGNIYIYGFRMLYFLKFLAHNIFYAIQNSFHQTLLFASQKQSGFQG